MNISPGSSDTTPPPPNQHRSTALLLLGTIADTTWRMFAPTLGFMALGMWADASYKTEPLFSLVGIGIGILVAALLIKRQFQTLREVK